MVPDLRPAPDLHRLLQQAFRPGVEVVVGLVCRDRVPAAHLIFDHLQHGRVRPEIAGGQRGIKGAKDLARLVGAVVLVGDAAADAPRLERPTQQAGRVRAHAVGLDGHARQAEFLHDVADLPDLAADDLAVVVQLGHLASQGCSAVPVRAPGLVLEHDVKRARVAGDLAACRVPVARRRNDPRLAQEHDRLAVLGADDGGHVVDLEAVWIEARFTYRFAVQLILAVPLVDGAGLAPALDHLASSEAVRPSATGVEVNQTARWCGKHKTIALYRVVHAIDQNTRMLPNAKKNQFRDERNDV